MPLGSYPAGIGPAGYDPVVPPYAPRNVRPPVSLRFDGTTRDFPIDAHGFYGEVDPVDQAVALALMINEGVIAAVPDLGNRLRRITRVSPAVAKTTAEDYVRLALSSLIAAKSVSIEKLEVQTRRGVILVAVTYRNLTLRDGIERTITAPLTYS